VLGAWCGGGAGAVVRVLSKQASKQARQGCYARVRCWVRVYLTTKLCYLTTKGLVFGAVGGRVRCGFILHPSFSLVLGLVLRERIRCKGKRVKITN
jgi:hypothetical protein